MPADLPVVGYLGDTRDDLVAHPRIWVLANERLPRTPTADLRANFLPDRTPIGESRQFGPLTLTAYRNGRARPVLLSTIDAQTLVVGTALVTVTVLSSIELLAFRSVIVTVKLPSLPVTSVST